MRITRRALCAAGVLAGADGVVSGMLVYPPRGQKAVPARRLAP